MLTTIQDNHLLSLTILHDHHTVLEVKVHQQILSRLNLKELLRLLRDLFPWNFLKKVEMSLERLRHIHFSEDPLDCLLVLLLQQEPVLVCMLIEPMKKGKVVFLEIHRHTKRTR